MVQIDIEETHEETEATAVLLLHGERLGGWGRARRNPADPKLPSVGKQVAMARALSDLTQADRPSDPAIERVEGGPVELH